ncbi:hypothetical protein [Achromobacter denitrificans]|uniref:hypothetical protein n=1 Tax=Achromobacter denitrificans TaxID=32002 RepID=UPI003D08C0A6
MSTNAQKKTKMSARGICRLTGIEGNFVDSHILPRALTCPPTTGEKIRETALEQRPISRPPSWYDNRLVIRAGEDILEAIDTQAIDQLRKHMLVWTSFPHDAPFANEEIMSLGADANFGVRVLHVDDARALRLFFLSVVWRAAESTRGEFEEVQLPPAVLQDIRERVRAKDPGDPWDYPIFLDQIITRGPWHNRTPIMESLAVPDEARTGVLMLSCVRIYLDGLVAKVVVTDADKLNREDSSSLVLGASHALSIAARTFEESRTSRDMIEVMEDNARRGCVF